MKWETIFILSKYDKHYLLSFDCMAARSESSIKYESMEGIKIDFVSFAILGGVCLILALSSIILTHFAGLDKQSLRLRSKSSMNSVNEESISILLFDFSKYTRIKIYKIKNVKKKEEDSSCVQDTCFSSILVSDSLSIRPLFNEKMCMSVRSECQERSERTYM